MCAFYKPSLKDKTLTRAKNWMTFVMAATPDLDLVVLTIESPSVRPLGRAVNGSTRRGHLESRHSRRRPHTKGGPSAFSVKAPKTLGRMSRPTPGRENSEQGL